MCKGKRPWLGTILCSALILPGIPKAFAGPHYVFAHYMVCFALYGESLDAYKREILDAQAAGIDGFALDVGEWNGPDTYYKPRVEMIYEAAESLTNGFKLFFSVDMANTNDIVQMVGAYAKRTNSFYYDGKLVLSSFGGNGVNWTNGVLQPLQSEGISVFFVPDFTTEGGTWQTLPQSATALVTKYGSFIDGLFDFAAGLPGDIVYMDNAYLQACRSAHKLCMAGCSPTYWGCNQRSSGRPYFESEGGAGIISQWQWIITNQPDWVEIVTWNDLNESTYVVPLGQPGQYYSSPPQRFSHAGYLELMKHYISWYKSGVEPAIATDGLFYFYRTHSTNAVASNTNDVPVTVFMGPVQDVIYTTAALTAPAELQIISGIHTAKFSLPAGISCQKIPFQSGAQNFILRRNGKQLASARGPDVVTNIQNYDYFVASGCDYALSPPTNMRVTKLP
jgi:hypothetical protein